MIYDKPINEEECNSIYFSDAIKESINHYKLTKSDIQHIVHVSSATIDKWYEGVNIPPYKVTRKSILKDIRDVIFYKLLKGYVESTSQIELADYFHVSESNVRYWLNGKHLPIDYVRSIMIGRLENLIENGF
jgi:DNA-binding transcriptional regulator YiaG